jgi:ribosome modulation factor
MPHRNQTVFDEGWQAWIDGAALKENPYLTEAPNPFPNQKRAADAWSDGWRAACEDSEHQESDPYGDRADFEYDRNR